jgi:tRNA (cmo5U34)-methyltransferase
LITYPIHKELFVSESPNTTNLWSEQNSATFIDLAELFVPARAEQIATLLDLIPARPDEDFTLVELASGAGTLAQAILERFPRCHYIALDGSQMMRAHMRQRLNAFQDRLDIRPFELAEQDWHKTLPESLRCVVSSLSVHHLSDAGKRQLFRNIFARLAPGGALLIADIIKPANQQIANLFARQYNEIVRQQSLAIRGDLSGYEQFEKEQWNYFTYGDSAGYDQPSLLHDQLRWLLEVRFSLVDCFWIRAGHAIYGGYK